MKERPEKVPQRIPAHQEGTAPQLSAEEMRAIDEERSHYESDAAAGLEALRIVQRERGWISDDSLRAVSAYLGIAEAELEGLATYYQLLFRQPVGPEVIQLCKSSSCWILGCDRLQTTLEKALGIHPGETSADGIFTLLENPCLGACDRAPVLLMNEELHSHLTEEKLQALLAEKRQRHADQSAD
ncbi:NADH-quinone oxidoreductase subunit NuoE [Microbulbifer flavimaris]|uniref:NADH-quinone oxidoreductase subunit E n=1 Tax=Microbulbifer flavimaris TaxID=1781068 RepID=A0ABX4HXK2_9GAMM|nr:MULTISPECIES: NADH-quinone oxidoreductase subunit NuoE [Microbulbifer]PCO04427.1 NADH-quinone oxidoreductase subunit NuoE [Microbulbifer flavimaris]